MKMRSIELAVGAFMIAGIASLLMLALQVSGLGNFFKEEPGYKVQAEFSNIGSLKVRAKVSVAGVVVGRVAKITLEPETYNAKVEFSVNPDRIEKLPGDTRASIMTSGLLGDNYIALTPGFDDANVLKEGSIIPVTNTDSAVVLEQLISKFVAGQASKDTAKDTQDKDKNKDKDQDMDKNKDKDKDRDKVKDEKNLDSLDNLNHQSMNDTTIDSDVNARGENHDASQ